MTFAVARRRFTVDEYHRMGEAGILREDDRVELIDGEVVQMTPIGSRHAGCVKRINHLLTTRLRERAVVAVQDPVLLGRHSEPQPDVMVLRPRPDFYSDSHPSASDVWLLIEVSDTTAQFDRTVKVPLYARAGIVEVWLVDLEADSVEVYRRPAPDGRHADVRRAVRGDRLIGQAVPDLDVAVEAILV
jgi:Uma2 family endonuclease